MAILRILSRRGDDCITWGRARAERADPGALAAVRAAKRILIEQRFHGATALRRAPGRAPTSITQLDPTADQTVLVPRVTRVIGG
jgi:hypothetical protein